MEDKTLLLQFLGENPTLKIIDFFLDNRTDYSKKEIIEATGMSKTTFYKVWKILEKFEVVSPTRRYGRAQLFKINENSDIVKKLMILDFTLIKHTMKKHVDKSSVTTKATIS
jgi:DNA-binding transcriptional regulator GbsR (MarR family)